MRWSTSVGRGSKTYSQLLALAERSAQQSIRTQRNAYSSVISRGTFGAPVRVGNNPEWDRGSSAETDKQQTGPRRLIHRPASSGSSAGEARSVAPASPVPPDADPAQKGRGEAESGDAGMKTLRPGFRSGSRRTFPPYSTSLWLFAERTERSGDETGVTPSGPLFLLLSGAVSRRPVQLPRLRAVALPESSDTCAP